MSGRQLEKGVISKYVTVKIDGEWVRQRQTVEVNKYPCTFTRFYADRLNQDELQAAYKYRRAHEIVSGAGTAKADFDGMPRDKQTFEAKSYSERAIDAASLIRLARKKEPYSLSILDLAILSELPPLQVAHEKKLISNKSRTKEKQAREAVHIAIRYAIHCIIELDV